MRRNPQVQARKNDWRPLRKKNDQSVLPSGRKALKALQIYQESDRTTQHWTHTNTSTRSQVSWMRPSPRFDGKEVFKTDFREGQVLSERRAKQVSLLIRASQLKNLMKRTALSFRTCTRNLATDLTRETESAEEANLRVALTCQTINSRSSRWATTTTT